MRPRSTRRTWLLFGGSTVAGALVAATLSAPSAFAATTVTVASDGSGNYTTVQAAINAVPSGNSSTYTINIKAGTYRETISIPSTKPYISLVGTGSSASSVVLVQNHAAGATNSSGSTYGTAGSASITIAANDTTVSNLTMSNDFNEAASSLTSKQAVAVNTYGDRVRFLGVRILGNQDTLLVNTPSTSAVRRLYVRNSYIEGDVDFIFGAGTAVFQGGEVHSLTRGSTSNNGYITAAATNINNKFGFLFWTTHLSSNAPAKTVYLGRPWHPSGDVNAIAQVLYRGCTMDAHIRDDPWTDMSGFSWTAARFFEYSSVGTGAVVNSNRPQMSASTAASYTPALYLAGSDSWNPIF
jgi:pectin methylesterase-like acyl-CoA thioesterase